MITWVKNRLSWQRFFACIQQDIKLFFYLLLLLTVFRLAFIGIMHEYLGSTVGGADIVMAMFYGMKLSLKSAGILAGISFMTSFLLQLVSQTSACIWRKRLSGFYIVVLSVLFCARIPYYTQFHSGFNQLIFNTVNDDMYALFISLIDQYQLPVRLAAAFVLGAGLVYPLMKWFNIKVYQLPLVKKWYGNAVIRLAVVFAFYQFAVFVNFGGSMSFAGNVDWENSGVTKDTLLNEAILDDLQALYRAYEINGRLESSTGLAYTPEDVAAFAKYFSGKNIDTNDLDAYLAKKAQGLRSKKPQHIFLILSESYANWPLLEKYQNLHIADGMKSIIAGSDSDYVGSFLPNGMSTISAVMGIVTGFSDANLYLTTMPEAYTEPYSTSIAPQFKRLGYQTKFWYAGPTSWERVKDFSLAQGFDEFYGSGDYPNANGNVWGCDDEYLYEAVLAETRSDEVSFNIVLNVSNHSPFTVDLDKAGFPREQVRAALPDQVKQDEALIKQLGHFWYADKMMADFIKKMKKEYPDSVFIIMGDHGDRMNIDKTPMMYERYGIPLIVTGRGINKNTLPERAAGSQIDAVPTLIELVAPKGFTYYSVGNSLTRGNDFGVNYGFWITPDYIGKTDMVTAEQEAIHQNAEPPAPELVQMQVDAVRSISWWRSKYGRYLTKEVAP